MTYPPSVNNYWRRWKGKTVLNDKGRAYRAAARGLTDVCFGDSLVRVSLFFVMPDNRRRDLDNCLKAVFDAIGHAGIYSDDSQVTQLMASKVGVKAPGWVDVVLEEAVNE